MVYHHMSTIIDLDYLKSLCKLLVVAPLSLLVILAWTSADEALAQLRLDYAALRAAEDDYRDQREFSGLDGTEAADYAAYVASLQRRVFEDCEVVIRSGATVPDELPCPLNMPATAKSADISTQTEQTPEEQIAALDKMLNTGLGEFDERLLREQERIKATAPNDNPGNNSNGSGGNSGDRGEGSAGGEGTEGDSDGKGRNAGGRSGGKRGAEDGAEEGGDRRANGPEDSSNGSGEAGNDSDEPSDIPDGSDDDVVARQLREVAEKETDPELKAKLWEEYRRYKRGTN